MVRHYKGHSYCSYSEEELEKALEDITDKRRSIANAGRHYAIPRSTLQEKLKTSHPRKTGGQPVFTSAQEESFKKHLLVLANYGFPITTFDLRILVKTYLCSLNINEKRFTNNTPGKDWALSYLRRNKDLTQRFSANIKRSRAEVTRAVIKSYFENLKDTIPPDLPPENLFNYDETNLTDDPLNKKVIMKRGTKYPERVMNSSKASTSVMFCGNAAGELLPPYVVYKSEHLWNSWILGGPKGTRYNRTKSGWFDAVCFEDWFERLALPALKKKPGVKVLVGDNLSSHFSYRVLQLCQEHDIIFVSLPPNSTHLAQPLDVAFFRPCKYEWRKLLLEWKTKNGDKPVSKDVFPRLLKTLMTEMEKKPDSLKNGFRKCGLNPLDPDAILKRMPPSADDVDSSNVHLDVSASVLNFLAEQRYGKESEPAAAPRRKKIQVEPGRGVTLSDIQNLPAEPTKRKKDESAPKDKPKKRARKEKENERAEKVADRSANEFDCDVSAFDSDQEDDPDVPCDDQNDDPSDVYPVGCFVIVDYEGEKFPGKVVNTDVDQTVEVSTMTMRGSDWAWPTKPDETWYHFDKVLEIIKEPQLKPCFSKRAHRDIYVVPEIAKYRPNLC